MQLSWISSIVINDRVCEDIFFIFRVIQIHNRPHGPVRQTRAYFNPIRAFWFLFRFSRIYLHFFSTNNIILYNVILVQSIYICLVCLMLANSYALHSLYGLIIPVLLLKVLPFWVLGTILVKNHLQTLVLRRKTSLSHFLIWGQKVIGFGLWTVGVRVDAMGEHSVVMWDMPATVVFYRWINSRSLINLRILRYLMSNLWCFWYKI